MLSTAHIPHSDAQVLDRARTSEKLRRDYWWVEWTEFGYRILADTPDIDKEILVCGRSVALLQLVRLARKLKCKWLLLDADGLVRDELPQFEW